MCICPQLHLSHKLARFFLSNLEHSSLLRKWYKQQMQWYSWPREVNCFTDYFTAYSVPLWMKHWSSRQKHLNHIFPAYKVPWGKKRNNKKTQPSKKPTKPYQISTAVLLSGLLTTMGEFWFYLGSRPRSALWSMWGSCCIFQVDSMAKCL